MGEEEGRRAEKAALGFQRGGFGVHSIEDPPELAEHCTSPTTLIQHAMPSHLPDAEAIPVLLISFGMSEVHHPTLGGVSIPLSRVPEVVTTLLLSHHPCRQI